MGRKAIIIGAGIGGLATAIRLAAKHYDVELIEANDYPGGKLSEFSMEGFRFDAGPSLFTMPWLVDELFALAGEKPEASFRYRRVEEICRYFWEDGTDLTARSDKSAFGKEVYTKTGLPANSLNTHLRRSAFVYRATSRLFLGRSLHKISTYLSWGTFLSFLQLPFLHIFTTMNRLNEKALGNDKMVQLFNRYATYNGSDPYRAPGILHIIPHLEFNLGTYFPEGGMHAITRSIYELCLRKGVKFSFGTPAEKIRVMDGMAKAVKVGEREIPADLVVCNLDVFFAYRKLMPDQRQPEKILSQERSSSALIFYWGINREFQDLRLHNIFFSEDYRAEFDHLFRKSTVYEDPTVYIHISSKMESEDSPKGMENWFVMINVPANKGQDWDTMIPYCRERIIQKLNRMLHVKLEEHIVCEDLLDPVTIESKTGSFMGSLYGTSSNSRMAAFFRHPNFSSSIRNLYFCGGSVHPGGGIPLALSSAAIVDSMIPVSEH